MMISIYPKEEGNKNTILEFQLSGNRKVSGKVGKDKGVGGGG